MRTKIFAAALIASTAIAAPAFAQDSTFTGPRAEAIVGWDHVSDESFNADNSRDGVVYGGQVGYDFQRGNAVFGIEGEVTGASTKDTGRGVLVAGDELRTKAGRDLYAGARLGFLVGENALIYAKGGYTNAQFKTRYSAGTTTISDSTDVDGWRLGAGAEVKLTDKLYLKGEYRYSKYNDDDNGVDAKRHQVIGGVGIRF